MRVVLTYHVYLPEEATSEDAERLFSTIRQTIEELDEGANVYEAQWEER